MSEIPTRQELRVLKTLKKVCDENAGGRGAPDDVAQRMGSSYSSAYRFLSYLIDKGLVDRTKPAPHFEFRYAPTTLGIELLSVLPPSQRTPE